MQSCNGARQNQDRAGSKLPYRAFPIRMPLDLRCQEVPREVVGVTRSKADETFLIESRNAHQQHMRDAIRCVSMADLAADDGSCGRQLRERYLILTPDIMSVHTAAIMSHRWPGFSYEVIGEISRAASSELHAPRLFSESGSAEWDFANYSEVTFGLAGGFTLRFGNKVLGLNYNDRWRRFLMYQEVRQQFFSACSRVACLAGAKEILLLPEGTILEDSLYDGVDFDEIKWRATQEWGPADLEISKLYTEEESNQMRHSRVHYFLVPC